MLDSLRRIEIRDLGIYTFIKCVGIGNLSLSYPLTQEQEEEQKALLQKCLTTPPEGRIIGQDTVAVLYKVDDEQVRRELVTYHIGFKRKPYWLP
jgi:hypothetical protein